MDRADQLPTPSSQLPNQTFWRSLRLRIGGWELGVGSWQLIAALAVAGAVTGCGKKGPPLTPIVRVPAAVENLATRRVGDDVYVTFTVPKANIDASAPASIARVEVYAATALTPPTRARFLEIATLVGTVPVAPAADPANPGAVVEPDPKAGALQGTAVTVRDRLTPDAMRPRALPVLEAERRAAPPAVAVVAPRANVLRRFYMAIPFGMRGLPGPRSQVVELPLTTRPEPPTGLEVTTSATTITLRWEPSGGLIGWLLDRALPVETSPVADALPPRAAVPPPVTSDLAAGPTRYNVYLEIAPDPLLLPAAAAAMPWNATAPQPVNAAPLAVLTYAEPIVLDERERCYSVGAIRGTIESAPTPRECVTPIDSYPPAAPSGLDAVAGEGSIELIWDPNVEADLGGYIVLRAEAGGDTLLQLTATPISATRYPDRTVTPGVRYTYVVRAVDNRVPLPNMSDPAEVSETAR